MGVQYLSGSASFVFAEAPAVSTVSPSASPMRGGAQLTVLGSGFGAAVGSVVECRFGRRRVRAARTDGGEMACVAPSAAATRVVVGSAPDVPIADLSGVWVDGYGRSVRVCSRGGALAASMPEASSAATAIWEPQASAAPYAVA